MSNVIGLERRIAKLEGGRQTTSQNLTFDELNVALLDCHRSIALAPEATAQQKTDAAASARAIESDIVAMAAKQRRPSYAVHLDYVGRELKARGVEYVPALTRADCGMAEYDGWDAPDLMQRRAALRARPDIAELLARSCH